MFCKIFTRILVVLLLLCPIQPALCEEEENWPDEVWQFTDEDFDFDDDMIPYESEIAAWYDAMDVYDMFFRCPVNIDYDQPNEDGTMYLVDDDRFMSLHDLLEYARYFFSDELAAQLLGSGMYVEEGGLLYARDVMEFLDDNIGDIEIVIVNEADRVEYEVTVIYLSPNAAGNEQETLLYTCMLIDDEWRFTVFPRLG